MLRRATPGPWWSTEKAFWTRSLRLQAKAEALPYMSTAARRAYLVVPKIEGPKR